GQSLALTLDLPAVDNAVALPGTAFYGQNRIYTIQNELLVSHQVERLGSITDRFDQPRILISANNLPVNSKILITQLPNAISGLAVKASPAAQTAANEEQN
ncbi:MAG: multidrug transporter, partial [Oceanospirillum sp.]|nr:multidrug transporter [Oceanospirillum sp.]